MLREEHSERQERLRLIPANQTYNAWQKQGQKGNGNKYGNGNGNVGNCNSYGNDNRYGNGISNYIGNCCAAIAMAIQQWKWEYRNQWQWLFGNGNRYTAMAIGIWQWQWEYGNGNSCMAMVSFYQGRRRGRQPKLCRRSWPDPKSGKIIMIFIIINIIIQYNRKCYSTVLEEYNTDVCACDLDGCNSATT